MDSRRRKKPDRPDGDKARLTPREVEVLGHLARGLKPQRIAEELSVARVTVDMHLSNARRKLGAVTREQAVAQAVYRKLIEL